MLTLKKKERCIKLLREMEENGCSITDLINLIEGCNLSSVESENTSCEKDDVEKRIAVLFRKMGLPANLKGYNYIKNAICLAYEKNEYLYATNKMLYPAVAEKYKTTSTRVERAIRHAIEVSFNRGNVEILNKMFGYAFSGDKGKSTNNEFIAGVVEFLKNKEDLNI